MGFLSRDRLFILALRSATAISAAVIFLVVLFVAGEALMAFSTDSDKPFSLANLFGDPSWDPANQEYNLTPMIVGSLAATFGSLVITAPTGIGAAVFLNFYAPEKVGWCFRRVVEILAGVPSVVYGLWGLSVLVPLIGEISPLEQGQSLLAGVLILSFMTIPTVVIAADAALQAVAPSQINAAAALGLGKRASAWKVAVPSARWALFSAVILQVARAIGETMAVLMVCGNIVQLPSSVFHPVRTLTANIALEMGYADEGHRAMLFLSGVIGLILVAFLIAIANLFSDQEEGRI